MMRFSRLLLAWVSVLALLSCNNVRGKSPAGEVIGRPTGLAVSPSHIVLPDARAVRQVVVTGQYGGEIRDLTPFASYRVEDPAVAAVSPRGLVQPKQDGTTTLIVQAGGRTARVPLTVRGYGDPKPVSFRYDVIAAFNVAGCNMGACHGTPSGKNGFRLSLRGFDPEMDHVQLTRDVLGRRTNHLDPDESLILKKGLGRVPHEGGQRFAPHSPTHEVIRRWIAEGLKLEDVKSLPAISKVEVVPGDRVHVHPAQSQQLAVIAHFSNGEQRDVTSLSVFTSSEPSVADVDRDGFVQFRQPGEAAILVRYLEHMVTVRQTYLKPKENFAWPNPPEHNYVDRHVFAKLKMMNILPSELCSDEEFIRRVYLDVCGILPTADEVRAFLASKAPDKRAKLIDQLLERPEYADFWTLKWADVLRANRKTMQLQGVHKFQEWLRDQIAQNRPFDEMVRELLTAEGSTYKNPAANYFRVARDPTSLAETTAQLFLGVRMQCAKCHNHPFERWSQDDYYSLAAFFARVKQKNDRSNDVPQQGRKPEPGAEIIFVDRVGEVVQPRTNQPIPPRFLGGEDAKMGSDEDRRRALADWLTRKDNPFVSKSVVNRIWFHLVGRGIVDPVDDFRDSNPSSNDELLDALAKDFAEGGFDMKRIKRTILNSRTYQLSARTNESNKDDQKYFSHAVTKLYTAEQLLDAICAATAVPEKFAGLPLGTRAVQLPDGEVNHLFLKTFGQPARELACECEREGESNLTMALQLINGPTIHDKLRAPNNRIGQLLAKKLTDEEMIIELYLSTLARFPDEVEMQKIKAHLAKNADKRRAWEDVQWVLINCKEFLFRH